MATEVRRAGLADLDAASAVLADAFADYPWTRWTIDGADHVERIRGLQRLVIDRVALPYGEVWVAVGAAGDVLSAAVWMLPTSAVPDAVVRSMVVEQAALEGARHDASVAAEAFVSRHRPTTPHYYLGAVGTRRNRQGRGLGAAVLAPVLERADREGTHVFLETSSLDNVRFYERLGFATVSEAEVPDGGPHVWVIARVPSA